MEVGKSFSLLWWAAARVWSPGNPGSLAALLRDSEGLAPGEPASCGHLWTVHGAGAGELSRAGLGAHDQRAQWQKTCFQKPVTWVAGSNADFKKLVSQKFTRRGDLWYLVDQMLSQYSLAARLPYWLVVTELPSAE